MKMVLRLIGLLLLIYFAYSYWARNKWEPAGNQTAVMEQCRWKIEEEKKIYECFVRLSDGKFTGVRNIILSDDSHKEILVKVEVNKWRKKRKRFTFISSY